uniref:triacylglycerol lipase n=2 Tax=Electrophorus electricus TaxID=8005 RepID=A0A4W4EEA7_ELEEL
MLDLTAGWSISFAGCGFLGVYHIGVASCLLERAPHLVRGATRVYGASAGALTASVLTSHACLEKCCQDVMEVAKQARKRSLGPLHPTFNLVKILRSGLERDLPGDAHLRASGKLCVSLTRVSNGENMLVSDFTSKEELIQALICSCFIPVYCGLIPPSFRGVRYVDGGISDNLPQSELKNTITISPFSGESDICPRDNSSSFHELRLTNTSIQVNWGNAFRLSQALFPPEPKVLAEMCQSGYKDAYRFLKDNNLLRTECPTADLALKRDKPTCCCSGVKNSAIMESTQDWVLRICLLKEHHWWLDEQLVNNLPTSLKKVFCEACREKHALLSQITGLLPVRVASYVLLPCTLPMESAYSAVQRFVEWMPEVSADVRWLFEVAGSVYRYAWKGVSPHPRSGISMRRCISEPPTLDLQLPVMERKRPLPFSATDLRGYGWDSAGSSHESLGLRTFSPSLKHVCFITGSPNDYES